MKYLIDRQDLVVVNSLDICRGSITRERTFEYKTEKSVIDYIIVSKGLQNSLIEMKIDENKEYVLARYLKTKSGTKVINSDHNILSCKFSVVYNQTTKRVRKEFFKYKCEEGRKQFLDETSSNKFSGLFKNTEKFQDSSKRFLRTLKTTFHNCFKKVRIVPGQQRKLGNQAIKEKIKMRSKIKIFLESNECEVAQKTAETELLEIDEAIANELVSANAKIVKEYGKSYHLGFPIRVVDTEEKTFPSLWTYILFKI